LVQEGTQAKVTSGSIFLAVDNVTQRVSSCSQLFKFHQVQCKSTLLRIGGGFLGKSRSVLEIWIEDEDATLPAQYKNVRLEPSPHRVSCF
jgi:hypothetical protein